jgi:hypothetical protein
MLLAEGPICCIGTIALLILILGVMLMITNTGSSDEYYDDHGPSVLEGEEYEYGYGYEYEPNE